MRLFLIFSFLIFFCFLGRLSMTKSVLCFVFRCSYSFRDRPIAIAYSPTEPSPSHLADVYRPTPAHHQVSHPPIYRSTPADDDSSNNANQQFQAPFIPSINLENTQSTHNGWSIVTPPSVLTGPKIEPKISRISASLANANATSVGSISRSDSGEVAHIGDETNIESTTRKFDFYNFRPEFQSGFLPIYKGSIAPQSLAPPAAPIPPQKGEPVKVQSDEKSTDRSENSDNFNLESLLFDDDEDDDDGGNDDESDE